MGFNYFSTTPLAIPGVARAVYNGLASQNNFARAVQQKQLQIAERTVRLQELQAQTDKTYREAETRFKQIAAEDQDEDRKLQQQIEKRNQSIFDFERNQKMYERQVSEPLKLRMKASEEARLRDRLTLDQKDLGYREKYLQHEERDSAEKTRQYEQTRDDEIKGVRKKGAATEPGRMSDIEQKRFDSMGGEEKGLRERADKLAEIAAKARKAEDEAAAAFSVKTPGSTEHTLANKARARARMERATAEAQAAEVAALADKVAERRNAFLDTLERAQQPAGESGGGTNRVIRQLSDGQIKQDFRDRAKRLGLDLTPLAKSGLLTKIGQQYNELSDEERDDLWARLQQRYGTKGR